MEEIGVKGDSVESTTLLAATFSMTVDAALYDVSGIVRGPAGLASRSVDVEAKLEVSWLPEDGMLEKVASRGDVVAEPGRGGSERLEVAEFVMMNDAGWAAIISSSKLVIRPTWY